MNTREYIESGILESYCLGQLSIEEMRQVEAAACQHAEIREEIFRIQQALEQYAEAHAVAPPSQLKKRLLRRVEREHAKARYVKPGLITLPNRYRHWAVAASIAWLLTLLAAGVLWMRTDALRSQLAEQQRLHQELLLDQDQLRRLADAQSEQLQLLTDANTRRVLLKGTAHAPISRAMVYWNQSQQRVFLDANHLPPLSADKQYQLWYITSQNKPMDAGVFDATAGMIKMKTVPEAVAFAITIEPRGGSQEPTLDQMVVLGYVDS